MIYHKSIAPWHYNILNNILNNISCSYVARKNDLLYYMLYSILYYTLFFNAILHTILYVNNAHQFFSPVFSK